MSSSRHKQAHDVAACCRKQLLSELGPDFSADDLRVYHSPFSRTKGTAELAAQAFGFGAGDERLQARPGRGHLACYEPVTTASGSTIRRHKNGV